MVEITIDQKQINCAESIIYIRKAKLLETWKKRYTTNPTSSVFANRKGSAIINRLAYTSSHITISNRLMEQQALSETTGDWSIVGDYLVHL